MSLCTSCHAVITFVRTKNGAAMPVDPEPIQVLVATGRSERGPDGQLVAEFEVRRGFRSHFASCPFADQHRKKR